MLSPRKKNPENNYTGLYDDEDNEIFIGDILQHEIHFRVIVVKNSSGEVVGEVTEFIKSEIAKIYLSLENGKGFTKINNNE